MNVISGTPSTIEIAPRYFIEDVIVSLENEETNVIGTFSSTLVQDSNYTTLDISSFTFKDGNYYLMKVLDNDTELFKGKIYYNTTISTPFSRNTGKYKEVDKNTKYIIYNK